VSVPEGMQPLLILVAAALVAMARGWRYERPQQAPHPARRKKSVLRILNKPPGF
jgi:hypothetical protein